MKEILIISGKGGTGKTVLTAALAGLAKNKIMADCDVDAADLHLLLKPNVKERHEFRSGKTAVINKRLCNMCGKCVACCRFEAMSRDFRIDPISCEGCGFCSFICPTGAIKMRENVTGEWFISDTRFGPMVHAKLGIAEENSGKLVSLVRQKAKELASSRNCDWIIVDGAPGIGCPVIASLSGVDCALVVTEPTLTGLHDADRVIKVARHFKAPVKVIINKYDLNMDMTEKINQYCADNDIQLAGRIPFDNSVVKAMVQGKTIMEYPGRTSPKEEIKNIWRLISA